MEMLRFEHDMKGTRTTVLFHEVWGDGEGWVKYEFRVDDGDGARELEVRVGGAMDMARCEGFCRHYEMLSEKAVRVHEECLGLYVRSGKRRLGVQGRLLGEFSEDEGGRSEAE